MKYLVLLVAICFALPCEARRHRRFYAQPQTAEELPLPKFQLTWHVYRDSDKKWRWQLKSGNNEIVAHGESYERQAGVDNVIGLITKGVSSAHIVVEMK